MSRGLSKQQNAMLAALAHQWAAGRHPIDSLYGFYDDTSYPYTHTMRVCTKRAVASLARRGLVTTRVVRDVRPRQMDEGVSVGTRNRTMVRITAAGRALAPKPPKGSKRARKALARRLRGA